MYKKDQIGLKIIDLPGFHGDFYLIKVATKILENCKTFIETGAYHGHTVHYIAINFPNINCYSCEPHKKNYSEAFRRVKDVKNIKLSNKVSIKMLKRIIKNKNILEQPCLIFLDAHSFGFNWPLRNEIQIIANNFKRCYIIIDDFKVPLEDQFQYDTHNGMMCSYDYIKNDIKRDHSLFYPTYKEHTSSYHPLVGWCLISFGINNIGEIIQNFDYLKTS